jgi:hypothetical protein
MIEDLVIMIEEEVIEMKEEEIIEELIGKYKSNIYIYLIINLCSLIFIV